MPQKQWKLEDTYVPWYVGWWSNACDNRASEILKQYYEMPPFLPDGSNLGTQQWIFMGTPGFGASFHQDVHQNPTWQAQVTILKT